MFYIARDIADFFLERGMMLHPPVERQVEIIIHSIDIFTCAFRTEIRSQRREPGTMNPVGKSCMLKTIVTIILIEAPHFIDGFPGNEHKAAATIIVYINR